MNTKFVSFETGMEYRSGGYVNKFEVSAITKLNNWLKENPNIEIVNWQTCSVGEANRLCITVEYREKEVA